MKLVSQFTAFLKETVNLNQTRIDLLEGNVEAIQNFIRQCDWKPRIRGFADQGSWAHDTIIKPVAGGEFDADLLVMVAPVEGWSAKDYVAELGKTFAASPTYGEKARTWDYCVTVTYPGERKVDIAPLVLDRKHSGSLEVCNRSADDFEDSEPLAYTEWLRQRNALSGSNSFRKVTRLLKYLRDIKTTFTCPSVLLTTLLGMHVHWYDKDTGEFADVPTTLRTVMGRLDDWLQARPAKPRVENPKLRGEDFAAGWTDSQYSNFRSFIHKYRGWIDDAYEMEGKSESIVAWRRIFGDAFAKGEDVEIANTVSQGTSLVRTLLISTAAHRDGLVEAVRQFGISILPGDFYRPPHMQEPAWRRAAQVSGNVRVSATWHARRDGVAERHVRVGEVLSRRGGLWFEATVNGGQALPPGFRVQWRITNTGAVALSLNQGRGGFYAPQQGTRRWEGLQYRGVHIAEAFIIRTSDDVLVGQSPPFNVVIE
jgi:hypothetical protein